MLSNPLREIAAAQWHKLKIERAGSGKPMIWLDDGRGKNNGLPDLAARWMVRYYIYSEEQGCMVLKQRSYEMNRFPAIEQRMRIAHEKITLLEELLSSGSYLEAGRDRPKATSGSLRLVEMMARAVDNKTDLREKTIKGYRGAVSAFATYLRREGLHRMQVDQCPAKVVHNFLRDVAARGRCLQTQRNYRARLHAVWEEMKIQEWTSTNPVSEVKIRGRRKLSKKNWAFTFQEMQKIWELLQNEDPQSYVYTCLMFYGLLRREEARQIRAGQIDFENKRIFKEPGQTKNRQDKFAFLPAPLAGILINYGVLSMDPGERIIKQSRKTIYAKFRKILPRLGFGRNYTVYSCRHAGVRYLLIDKKADPLFVMEQGGWRSFRTFEVYRKSIGLADFLQGAERYYE